jgi:predicted lipoprotein with Yx(FWY)xxD motif
MTKPDPYKAVIGGSKHKANIKATMLIVLAVVILAALIGGTYTVFHKSPKTKNDTTANSADTSKPQNPNTPKPGAVQINNSILVTQTYAELGQFIGDPNGRAVYTYGKDKSGVSNCDAACVANWPIYDAATTTDLPKNVTVVTRADGQRQYAYKGMPLYYYIGDDQGQVTGDGLNDFHVAKP